MRYNPRLHCSAGCLRADGRATSEPYQMRVRPSRGPGGRGRRGRAGGHGATSSRARHERIGGGGGVRGGGGGPRWRALTRSLIRARAAPDHTAAPAPRSPGGLWLTSHLSPLTSWAAAAGPAREGSSANFSSFQICSVVGLRGAGQTGKRRCRGCPHSTFEVAVRSKHVRLPPINAEPVFAQL